MSWKVSKEALEAALNILSAVPARHGNSASEFIKIENLKSRVAKLSLSSEMSGTALLPSGEGCPFKYPVYIDKRMLYPFVTAGKDLSPGYYGFRLHEGSLIITHGKRIGKFKSNKEVHGYTSSPKLKEKSHRLVEELASILCCARNVAVDDPVAPHLSCVYIYPKHGELIILSANDHQFFLGEVKKPEKFSLEKAALPLPLVDATKTENAVNLIYSDRVALLTMSCGMLWHPVKSQAKKNFPYRKVEDLVREGKKGELLFRVDSQSLYDAVARAAEYMSSISVDESVLQLEATNGAADVRIKCSSPGADFEELIRLSEASKGDTTIDWPLKAIKPILNYCSKVGEIKILRTSEGRTCFIAGKIAMLIAPVQKKKKHSKKSKSKKAKKEGKE